MRMKAAAALTKMKNLWCRKNRPQAKWHRMVLRINGRILLLIWVICRSTNTGTIMLGFQTFSPMPPPTTSKTLTKLLTAISMHHKASLFPNGRSIRRMKMKQSQMPRELTLTSSKASIDSLMTGLVISMLTILITKTNTLQNLIPNVSKKRILKIWIQEWRTELIHSRRNLKLIMKHLAWTEKKSGSMTRRKKKRRTIRKKRRTIRKIEIWPDD